MADAKTSSGDTSIEVPKLPPGTLIGTEVSHREALTLTLEEKNALRELARTVQQRDMPAYREEVIRVWEKRLFDRGHQHLLPQYAGGSLAGWSLPAVGSGYGPGEDNDRSIFETNIYNPNMKIIVSVLTREVPHVRFEPSDLDDDADITAADKADELQPQIDRNNKLISLMAEMGRFLWTDGRSTVFTRYIKDGTRFGYQKPKLEAEEQETVPEDEEQIEEEEEAEGDGGELSGDEADQSDEAEDGEGAGESSEDGSSDNEPRESEPEPRGWPVIEVLGALESKFPIKEDDLPGCNWAQVSREIDLQVARARYPEMASDIKASTGGPGGDDVDRLARINVRLGVLDNFVTSDSAAYDVTEQITWFRAAALLEVKTKEERDSLMKKASTRGLRVIFCGETFCEARSISMEEQLTVVHAQPGDGMHRPGLGDWLIPIQKVINNWSELADDYFTRGVPAKWMDNEMFSVEKLRDQVNMVGAVHPFDREPGVQMTEAIFEETPVVIPAQLWESIQFYTMELPQLLCGAYNALSGAGDTQATDTFGGMLVQRDQAIGVIGLPWRNIKEAMCSVKRQAIQCLAWSHEEGVRVKRGEEAVLIEMEDLKGNILAFPEVDENIPESPTQKQNRMTNLWNDAAANPQVAEFVYTPDNLEIFLRSFGVKGFYLPQVVSRDKQLGELAELLRSGPVPNPKIRQLKKQLVMLQAQALQAAQTGAAPDPAMVQQSQQLQHQITQLTATAPQVSSVEIDEEADDHVTEAAVCWKAMMSPRGRKLKNGDEDEQAGYQNMRLHWGEHTAAAAKKQAEQQPKGKPPSVSIALKDLPSKEAAAAATMAGIPATAQDFEQQDAAEALEKHPGPGGVLVQ